MVPQQEEVEIIESEKFPEFKPKKKLKNDL